MGTRDTRTDKVLAFCWKPEERAAEEGPSEGLQKTDSNPDFTTERLKRNKKGRPSCVTIDTGPVTPTSIGHDS